MLRFQRRQPALAGCACVGDASSFDGEAASAGAASSPASFIGLMYLRALTFSEPLRELRLLLLSGSFCIARLRLSCEPRRLALRVFGDSFFGPQSATSSSSISVDLRSAFWTSRASGESISACAAWSLSAKALSVSNALSMYEALVLSLGDDPALLSPVSPPAPFADGAR